MSSGHIRVKRRFSAGRLSTILQNRFLPAADENDKKKIRINFALSGRPPFAILSNAIARYM
ncbi:hypothetical protein HMPREF1250_0884 [Megasphaera vaginalis (ex Srinivasan et al. 2021)]|uniref:Uncharacterized protein n=1 Tax=Megasphaera vaginalis (ex Srinivasan et al. 2021) TaxID=1111454 RepID=U7UMC5_9FIRM|nr:hypothetical protein HMPREF1250_0884 [Megasphaera vaginalis (ex Srinivasan et al. 2021)]